MSPSTTDPMPSSAGAPRLHRRLLLAVVGLSALLAFLNLDRGWIPHDEGTLAQSAERVLQGELPHRDFDEVYTGGLSVLNAVAFKVLGVNLLTPRIVLFLVFLAWVPTLFYVATRFVGPPLASLAVLLAASWSIPVYPAAMPSWYNLFFATFGLAGLLKHLEGGERRWLFAAGLAGGCSILMKSAGVFFVAAGLLFLAHREQVLSRQAGSREDGAGEAGGDDADATDGAGGDGTGGADGDGTGEPDQDRTPQGDPTAGAPRPWAYGLFASAALLLFVALLVLLVGDRSGPVGVLRFIVPLGALSAWLLWSEWAEEARVDTAGRFRTLLHLGLPFVGGVLVPLGVLVLVYVLMGAGGDLYRGLFVLPTRRLAEAAYDPPGLATLWVAAPLVVLLLADALAPLRARRVLAGVLLVGAAAVVAAPRTDGLLSPMWYLMNALGPITLVAGVALLVRWRRGLPALARQRAVAVLAVAAAVMLIQFPFAGPIYLFYALPVLVPAGLVVLARARAVDRPVFGATLVLLLAFSVRWINTGELFSAGRFPFDPTTQTAAFSFERGGGIRVSPEEKEVYERLTLALRDLSTGPFIYATPDVPEVYFLSGLRNPTRTLYEFFDDPEGGTERILSALDSLDVSVVVLNSRLRFSGPPPPELLSGLRARYPQAAALGGFIVRWREGAP